MLKAADHRTTLLYAADAAAELSITAEEGSDVWYTTDGSTPEVNGATSLQADGDTISVEPVGNEDQSMTIKAIAANNGRVSSIKEVEVEFVEIPEKDQGTRVYTASISRAGVAGGPYDVKVKVTTVNGVISRLEDNGTYDDENNWETDGAVSDFAFWDGHSVMEAEGWDEDYPSMPQIVTGMTIKELLDMKTVPDDDEFNMDAVSGATVWSDSIRYATIAALRSEPTSVSEAAVLAPAISVGNNGNAVQPNTSGRNVILEITGAEDTTIRYTLDGSEPTAESDEIYSLGFYGDMGVRLNSDPTNHPEGQKIIVKAAAFDADGNRSDVTAKAVVFANERADMSYQTGTFSANAGDTTVNVTIKDPSYTGKSYITGIEVVGTSSTVALEELLGDIYLAQRADTVTASSENQEILEAVHAALLQAQRASKPAISVSPEKSNYSNDDVVTVTLTTDTEDAEIWYTIDNSNTLSGNSLSDPTKSGTKYEGPFEVNIDNLSGGNLYIRSVARIGEEGAWSSIERKDLTFVKGVKENAFEVDGQGYKTWNEAVDALTENGTLIINDDVELTSEDRLPEVACTIQGGSQEYSLSGSNLKANADLTFDNLTYKVNRIYANGHSLTINENVIASGSWLGGYDIYAGGTESVTGDATLTIHTGKFKINASGSGSTVLTGNVSVLVDGDATVDLAGAYMNSTVEGNVSFEVAGDAVTMNSFLGEQTNGKINGSLTLRMSGAPGLKTYGTLTYRGSVNGYALGTFDATGVTEGYDISSFTDFETILQ